MLGTRTVHHQSRTAPYRLLVATTGAISLALICLPVSTPPAQAASTITVTTTSDNTTTDTLCSLREAIANANTDTASAPDCTAGSGDDIIDFALSATPATITLDPTLGPLAPRGTVTIEGGPQVTISGADQTQIITAEDPDLQLTLDGLTFEHGRVWSGIGGAIDSRYGSLTIRDSTFADNRSYDTGAYGGAVSQVGGSLTVSGSTFTDNYSDDHGGAIGVLAGGSGAPSVHVSNSTFADNSAGDLGGALEAPWDTLSTTLRYNTFVDNSAPYGGAVEGVATLVGNIFQSNSSGLGQCDTYGRDPAFVDDGYNVSSDASCASASTSLASTDAHLDAHGLADNGGHTQTVAPQSGSPAIDLVPSGAAGCGTTVGTDQRGFLRPVDGNADPATGCDAGALEAGSRAPLRGTLAFDAFSRSVGEGDRGALLTVLRSGGSDGPVTIAYATADGTAAAPGDYTAVAGTLSFPDGVTTQTVKVPIVEDHLGEADETFTVTLTDPSGGATFAAPTTETVTITDDDSSGPPPPPPARCTIRGTGGRDVLRGTPGPDVICGRGGRDLIRGRGGDDVLRGGRGDDLLRGGRGDDVLLGGPGRDVLWGGPGHDRLVQ
jgi:CSLREA domain-containing protein